MNDIDEILHGSIDMHVHFGPDGLLARRMNALETAQTAARYGIRAIVLKSHGYPTTPIARLVSELVPEVQVFGSLCLDQETGGFNIIAAEESAKLGAKIIYMPTFFALNSLKKVSVTLGLKLKGEPLTVLDSSGKLLPQVKEILQIIKDNDLVLATGHISPREIFALVQEAKTIGVSRISITHPLETNIMEEVLTVAQQKELADAGAFIEHCFLALMPTGGKQNPAKMIEAMNTVGPARCIMSTDFGQIANPPSAEGMRMFIATMLKGGLSRHEVELMAKVNPARLLGLT